MPARQQQDNGERLIKLALFVKENAPVDLRTIRTVLPDDYGFYHGNDPDEEKRHDDKIRRRFLRDKDTLQDYGLFIANKSDQYYIDEQASYAAPVDLSESEASLLRVVCTALLHDESYPFKNELRMVLVKIGDDLGVPDLLPGMEASQSAATASSMPGIRKVRKALSARKRLFFDYLDAHGESSHREVEPFCMFLHERHCYVVAYDLAREDERTFRLDRMSHLRVNAAQPNVPDFDERPFNVRDYCNLPFQYGQDEFTARVLFDAENAWRAPRLCAEQGALEENDDDTLVWTVCANDARRLASWCIQNGPGILPVAPDAAREAYREGLKAARATLQGKEANLG